MGHQSVDGTDGRISNIVLVNQVVTIGNPVLALVAVVANLVVVVLLTPCSIGNLVPEGRSPSTYGGVEEDILAELLTYVTLQTDDALGILVAYVAIVGTYRRELARDAVELEEYIVVATELIALCAILVADEVVCSILECLVVTGIRELHATLVAPVLAAIVTALSITAHGAEPCTDASTHFLGCLGHVAQLVGETAVEGPFAIEVPAIVDNEHLGRHAIAVVELSLPLSHYVEHVYGLGVVQMLTARSSVVAVNLELVP